MLSDPKISVVDDGIGANYKASPAYVNCTKINKILLIVSK